jgi:hypothetical protein
VSRPMGIGMCSSGCTSRCARSCVPTATAQAMRAPSKPLTMIALGVCELDRQGELLAVASDDSSDGLSRMQGVQRRRQIGMAMNHSITQAQQDIPCLDTCAIRASAPLHDGKSGNRSQLPPGAVVALSADPERDAGSRTRAAGLWRPCRERSCPDRIALQGAAVSLGGGQRSCTGT